MLALCQIVLTLVTWIILFAVASASRYNKWYVELTGNMLEFVSIVLNTHIALQLDIVCNLKAYKRHDIDHRVPDTFRRLNCMTLGPRRLRKREHTCFFLLLGAAVVPPFDILAVAAAADDDAAPPFSLALQLCSFFISFLLIAISFYCLVSFAFVLLLDFFSSEMIRIAAPCPGGYFYAEVPLPGGGDEFRRFIYRVGFEDSGGADNNNGGRRGTVPLQFGREVLAEVMDNPDIRGMCC